MKLKGIIFDADGTLLDSMKFWDSIVYERLQSLGVTPDDNLIQLLTPLSMKESVEFIKDKFNLDISVNEIIEAENKIVEEFYLTDVKLKEGILNLLQSLQSLGIPMAVASATDRKLLECALNHLDIMKYFRRVFSCNEVGEGKTSPKVYLAACNFLGINSNEAVVAEDSLTALTTAANAGFFTIGVYDETRSDQWQDMEAMATLSLKNGFDTKKILDTFFS